MGTLMRGITATPGRIMRGVSGILTRGPDCCCGGCCTSIPTTIYFNWTWCLASGSITLTKEAVGTCPGHTTWLGTGSINGNLTKVRFSCTNDDPNNCVYQTCFDGCTGTGCDGCPSTGNWTVRTGVTVNPFYAGPYNTGAPPGACGGACMSGLVYEFTE